MSVATLLCIATQVEACAGDASEPAAQPVETTRTAALQAPAVARTEGEQKVIAEGGREIGRALPMTVTYSDIGGCKGIVTTASQGGAVLFVDFNDENYRVNLKEGGDPWAFESCDLVFRISGVRNLRFFVKKVEYAGYAILNSPSVTMTFSSTMRVVDNLFTATNATASHKLNGGTRRSGPWSWTHDVKLQNTGWSKCFANDKDFVLITLSTNLLLEYTASSPSSKVQSAMALLSSAYAGAEETVIVGPDPDAPPVQLVLGTEPCDASTTSK